MRVHQKEKIRVSDVAMGMFVAELDKPWLETPFMLQGFLIDDEIQIKHLRSLCRHVVIDWSLSIGEHYREPKETQSTEPKVVVQTIKLKSTNTKPHKTDNAKPKSSVNSFFKILQELKQGQRPEYVRPEEPESGRSTPMREPSISYVSNKPVRRSHTDEARHENREVNQTTLTEYIKQDLNALLTGSANRIKSLFNFSKTSTATTTQTNAVPTQPKSGLQQQRTSNSQKDTPVVIRIYEEAVTVEEEIATIYPVFEKSQIATREIFENIAQEKNIDLTHIHQSIDEMVESIERNPDALMWLAKLKKTDDYAYNHALNVSINLMAFAQFMALPTSLIHDLGIAGLLQDIGKIQIAAEILRKKEPLTKEEYATIKTHVRFSIDTLLKTANISERVMQVVRQHHERFDGSGYPDGLKGDEILLGAQMAGIMDTYCAMTTTKPYSKGLFSQEVLEKIYATQDKSFSAAVVNQLIQFFGIYPVSSLVELNTGEVAVVIQQNHIRRLQPRVMVLLNPDKSRNPYPITLDLILSPNSPNGDPYTIVRGLPSDSYGLNPSDYYV